MAQTRLITVSASQPSAIVVGRACAKVTIGEDGSVAGNPTTDWLLSKPSSSDTQIRFRAGTFYTFTADRGLFAAGDTIGFVQAVSGATTFFVDEGGSEIGHG